LDDREAIMSVGADEATRPTLGFDTDSTVDVRAVDEKTWAILRELGYRGTKDRFTVPIEQKTDFASVPRIFVWFLPRYGRYTKAAILHDYLWSVEVPAGRISRVDADGLFRQAMRELGVPFLRRWIMWAAVRWGALTKSDGRKGWLKEGWRVLLVTAVAFPIVAPAAVVILLTLPIFYLVEFIVWIPLEISRRMRSRKDRAAKVVNKPTLQLKL
jgi:Protein of unknown function (DUF1353)